MMEDCLFCKIIRGESAAEAVLENRHALAIMDINPIHFGHVLIMPKTHYATFVEVPPTELSDVIHAAQIISKAIVKSLAPEGYNIFSNNGKAAGQSIFHFHFHVTPRYPDDNIQFILKLKKYATDEMTAYADRLRQHITTNIEPNIQKS
jgi:histidine triad (HIT) family protein